MHGEDEPSAEPEREPFRPRRRSRAPSQVRPARSPTRLLLTLVLVGVAFMLLRSRSTREAMTRLGERFGAAAPEATGVQVQPPAAPPADGVPAAPAPTDAGVPAAVRDGGATER